MALAESKTMNEATINPAAFHLTGQTAASGLDEVDGMDLRPVLFAGFTDLAKLRYDFPAVLGNFDNGFVRPLSAIINDILREIAPPGVEGEYARSQILRLEREIRADIIDRGAMALSKAWDHAADKVRSQAGNGSLEQLDECLDQARSALSVDGHVIDCGADTPMAFVRLAWAIDQ